MRGNMRAERARIGKSADEVARSIGVSPNALLSWESDEKEPKSSNLLKLSAYYGCAPEYLLGITDDRHGFAVANSD